MKSLMHPLFPALRPLELVLVQKWMQLILESLCMRECANERGSQKDKKKKDFLAAGDVKEKRKSRT